MMALEFVVFNNKDREIDWIDPYQGHTDNGDGTYEVDNGYFVYHVEVPEDGHFVIRTREDSNG